LLRAGLGLKQRDINSTKEPHPLCLQKATSKPIQPHIGFGPKAAVASFRSERISSRLRKFCSTYSFEDKMSHQIKRRDLLLGAAALTAVSLTSMSRC
jgi:hypothetical protein